MVAKPLFVNFPVQRKRSGQHKKKNKLTVLSVMVDFTCNPETCDYGNEIAGISLVILSYFSIINRIS
jgi:hypothetical protein